MTRMLEQPPGAATASVGAEAMRTLRLRTSTLGPATDTMRPRAPASSPASRGAVETRTPSSRPCSRSSVTAEHGSSTSMSSG